MMRVGECNLESTHCVDSTSGLLLIDQLQLMLPRLALQNKYPSLYPNAQLTPSHACSLLHNDLSKSFLCTLAVCKIR